MMNWDAWKRPICGLLAAILLLAMPLDGALAAREALVKADSATARTSASGGGKAVFTLKKGARVTVSAVRGSVARVTYKGKTGYLLTSCLSLSAAEAEKKLLRDATVYKAASKSAQTLGKLEAGDRVNLLDAKGSWAKVQKDGQTGFILKSAFDAPATVESDGKMTDKSPESQKTLTTAVDAKFFAKASQSAAYKRLQAGTKVTVLSEKGSWYKVSKSGTVGFMLKKAFVKPAPTATPAPAFKTLKQGATGSAVLKLQKRLEALGYLDFVPTGKYASTTTYAIKLFQSMCGLKMTGVADSDTQSALYVSDAKKSAMLSASVKPGDKGTGVKRLQARLRAKGYFTGKVNGVYAVSTEQAVTAYQAAAGLKQDGKAGPATLKSLYSSKAPKFSGKPAATPKPTETPKPSETPKPTATPKPAEAPKPTPKPANPPSKATSSKVEKVISLAKTKLGRPYVFGASGPSSYDCSGLLMVAYGSVGLSLPHSAVNIGYGFGKKVSRSELERGDIVCFNTIADRDLVDHVGIYLGNNSFLHASSGQGRVVISTLTGFYSSAFSWGRSVL